MSEPTLLCAVHGPAKRSHWGRVLHSSNICWLSAVHLLSSAHICKCWQADIRMTTSEGNEREGRATVGGMEAAAHWRRPLKPKPAPASPLFQGPTMRPPEALLLLLLAWGAASGSCLLDADAARSRSNPSAGGGGSAAGTGGGSVLSARKSSGDGGGGASGAGALPFQAPRRALQQGAQPAPLVKGEATACWCGQLRFHGWRPARSPNAARPYPCLPCRPAQAAAQQNLRAGPGAPRGVHHFLGQVGLHGAAAGSCF